VATGRGSVSFGGLRDLEEHDVERTQASTPRYDQLQPRPCMHRIGHSPWDECHAPVPRGKAPRRADVHAAPHRALYIRACGRPTMPLTAWRPMCSSISPRPPPLRCLSAPLLRPWTRRRARVSSIALIRFGRGRRAACEESAIVCTRVLRTETRFALPGSTAGGAAARDARTGAGAASPGARIGPDEANPAADASGEPIGEATEGEHAPSLPIACAIVASSGWLPCARWDWSCTRWD
jgi:hypothetical protein